MSTSAPEIEAVPQPAEAAPASLFKFAVWVHVGPGAEECSEVDEQAGTCRCPDSSHFHAWCRTPNQFQEKEIRERSLAAKARKMRQLRTDGTDANVILEEELETLKAEPDATVRMSAELVGYDWAEDYLAAVSEVRQLEDTDATVEEGEETPKLYEHVDDDQARFARLQALPEDERPSDEFEELSSHLKAYEEKVSEHFGAITTPKRESYESLPEQDLLDLVRRKRIENAGRAEFMHHYGAHEWLSCTYREQGGELYFRDLAHLEVQPEDVLRILNETFADLERTAREAQGN